jgi:hypothetical protein
VTRALFRAIAALFALWALARLALAALLWHRALPEPELARAGAVALVAWAAYDSVAARALVREELRGRMLGFVSAAVHAVAAYALMQLCVEPRWLAAIVASVAVAAALAVVPSSEG